MANLRFISASIDKIQEYTELLKPLVFTPLQLTLQEFFGDEIREVVRQKVLRAYKMKRAPLFVEHTGIFIDAVGGMPGPFTSLFWQHMQAQGLLRLVQCERDRRATLKLSLIHI